jgi:DNA repair protein SbcD/Mre11
MFRIGFFSDTHLGYAAKCRPDPKTGINARVLDGYRAFSAIVNDMITAEVDLVIHGGDLFHKSWPEINDIVWARQELNKFTAAGIPVVGTTGNHDAATDRAKAAATAAVTDRERGVVFVQKPVETVEVVPGLKVTALSHYGLARRDRIVPEPVEGYVNLLVAHGAAALPGHELFHCVDSPGEQPIGMDILADPRWAGKLLGHYHGMGPLPGLNSGPSQAWYAGSTVRRGFSDPEGGRGWLQVVVNTDGTVVWERKTVQQRPQFDLPVIDAVGLTGAEIHERALFNLTAVPLEGAIVRQVVTNVSAFQRAGVNLPALNTAAGGCLQWLPVLRRPETAVVVDGEIVTDPVTGEVIISTPTESLATAHAADLPAAYREWGPKWVQEVNLPEKLRNEVLTAGETHLTDASTGIEGEE